MTASDHPTMKTPDLPGNRSRQSWKRRVEGFFRTHRSLLLPSTYCLRRRLLREQPVKSGDDRPRAVLHSTGIRIDGPQGRRIYTLAVMFLRSGYDVTLVLDLRFAGNLSKKLKRLLLDEPLSYAARLSDIPGDYLLVSDSPPRHRPQGCRKLVQIDYGRWAPGTNTLPLPFPMHPWVYRNGLDHRLEEYRNRPRRIRLFFMGDIAEKYSTHEVASDYGKLPRDKIVDVLQQRMPSGTVRRVRTLDEWRRISEEGFDGVVLGSTRDFQIPAEEWLQTVASADAFMVCPGVHYPMCHNAVESLAVGTIPLLEYPRFFHPVLKDGENCLEFAGEDGLLATVQKLLSMDSVTLRRIQTQAAQHYDTQLAPAVFTQQIEAWPSDPCRLMVLAHQSKETP